MTIVNLPGAQQSSTVDDPIMTKQSFCLRGSG